MEIFYHKALILGSKSPRRPLEDKLEVKINTDAKNEVCYCSPIIKLFGNVTISNLMKIITRPIKVVVHFWINSFA